ARGYARPDHLPPTVRSQRTESIPQIVANALADRPNGAKENSPGSRGTSYPGFTSNKNNSPSPRGLRSREREQVAEGRMRVVREKSFFNEERAGVRSRTKQFTAPDLLCRYVSPFLRDGAEFCQRREPSDKPG